MSTRRRITRVRNALREKGLDALLVTSLHNIRYLSGFSGTHALCIVRRREAYFLTDSRYGLQSAGEVRGFRRKVTALGLLEGAADQRLLARCGRVGLEAHHITYAQYRSLRRLFPSIAFVSTRDLVEQIAMVKEREELEAIRTAVRISDRVYSDVVKLIRPGVRELEIAAEISYLHRKYGAERDAFDPIVASGERSCLPHARAGSKRIRRGDLVTLDFGCMVRGYNSDMTRTVAVGRASRRARAMYAAVLEAQRAAIDEARGGMLARELDAVARQHIRARGFGRFFNHSLGHGLGLQVHERPRVSSLSKERLVAGSVITIEPGVYVPGEGGVRIEDDVLLGTSTCEVLNSSPKELMIL